MLVTNQIASLVKARRLANLANLAHKARIGVFLDDAQQFFWLHQAATDAGVSLDVYVEVDVGRPQAMKLWPWLWPLIAPHPCVFLDCSATKVRHSTCVNLNKGNQPSRKPVNGRA